jgi:hypothetical protein
LREGFELVRGDGPALVETHLLVGFAVDDGPVADAREACAADRRQ